MKIGIASPFHPAVGGVEAIARHLAVGFSERGHEVTVITSTAGAGTDGGFPFRVVRRPGPLELIREMARLDAVVLLGVMFRTAWAAVLTGTPTLISHQTWLDRDQGRLRPMGWLKRRYTAQCENVVASRALLTESAGRTAIVPNCYDNGVFRLANHGSREGLIFVGRLVSDKGADLLLHALARLGRENLRPTLTLVGDGPDRAGLERLVHELHLSTQVVFAGRRPPAEVAGLLNGHRILVVPSRWEEPFGIVALEGIACGCRVVVADGGGLRELAGPFGRVFPRNDAAGLAAALRAELERAGPGEPDQTGRVNYLRQFLPAAMVDQYLAALARRVNGPGSGLHPDPARCL